MIDKDYWPAGDAFVDLAKVGQLSDGRARCIGLAICDDQGRPTRTFLQGQAAHFFLEFEAQDAIGAPCARFEFRPASSSVIVHGKNTFQYPIEGPRSVGAGTRLRVCQSIELAVAPGVYSFSVGLGSVDESSYAAYRSDAISHEALQGRLTEHCRLALAGSFEVKLGPAGKSSHLGSADLPGTCRLEAMPTLSSDAPRRVISSEVDDGSPAIFHVAHWRAGSQWIYRILRECVADRIVAPQEAQSHFLNWPIQPGKVYPTVYVTREEFESVALPANWRRFVVIRDLRDTLVSGYFSLTVSHPTYDPFVAGWRERLTPLEREDALILLIDQWLRASARIQISWVGSGERVVRYEDLLNSDVEILERVLLDECQLPVSRSKLREAVLACRFERVTGGRSRGQEDVKAHARRGVAGDWRNYFTDRVKEAFKIRYGGLLVAAGYEKDLNW